MDKLIEFGLIHKGDKIYLTQKPEESIAHERREDEDKYAYVASCKEIINNDLNSSI